MALILTVSVKRAFWLGYLFGIGLFGAGIYWVFISVHLFGDIPNSLAAIITGGLIAVLALFPATVCGVCNRYFPQQNTTKIILAFPAIWVFSEWVRSWIFTGFPWLFLGYSQTNSPLKGYAPILSVYGVSLAVLVSASLIVNALIQLQHKRYKDCYFHVFILFLIWIVGASLSYIPWTKPVGRPISVSLIQGNVPQTIKWSPDHINLSLERYASLTDSAWGKDKLIIWPESAIPMPLLDAEEFIETLDKKAKETGSHLIVGIPIQTANKDGYYNALVTLGEEKQVYLKRRLVPFGEYTPFQNWLERIFTYMNIPTSNLVPGKFDQQPLNINHVKILASICYEITFPDLIKSQDKTLGFLLTVTNDAWFGESAAQAQHLQMAAMRAIEMGRPVIFASNDGITAIIGPKGKIEAAAPPRKTFVLNASVQPMHGLTPWMKNGMDPILFILICFIFVAVRSKGKISDPQKKITQELMTSENANGRTI